MKQAILLVRDGSNQSCGLAIQISIQAFLNRSRKTGLNYAVQPDAQDWVEAGQPVDIYEADSHEALEVVYQAATNMSLCPSVIRDKNGSIIGVGVGPYQDGVLNSVVSSIKKQTRG